jgi:hypothetical protein
MNATSSKWHCVVWHVGYPRMVSPIVPSNTHEAFRKKKRKKERKNNFILFIGWMTHALETGLVRIRAFTLRRCWFGAASNYKCLCVRAYIYVCEWVNVWVCVYVCCIYTCALVYVYCIYTRALVYVWCIYITGNWWLRVCACVPVERASLHRELHIHTHTYIQNNLHMVVTVKPTFPSKPIMPVCASVWCVVLCCDEVEK